MSASRATTTAPSRTKKPVAALVPPRLTAPLTSWADPDRAEHAADATGDGLLDIGQHDPERDAERSREERREERDSPAAEERPRPRSRAATPSPANSPTVYQSVIDSV